MKAKITMVGFEEDKLRFRFDCFPEEGEAAYDRCWVDVPVRPLTDAELADPELAKLVPTTKQLNPINCHFVRVDADVTQPQLRQLMAAHLAKLKHSLPRLIQAEQNFIGLEVQE